VTHAEILTSQYALVNALIAFTARRHRLSATERDDFASQVHEKLVENDYEVLRRFERRSNLRTYLTTVIERVFLDYRVALWGKWRPSAMAKRLGPTAVRLEMLTGRDNRSFQEAVQVLHTNLGVTEDESALYQIYCALPARTRRQFVGDESLADSAPSPSRADDAIREMEQDRQASRVLEALERVVQTLPAQDRLMLRLRFREGLTVASVARTLGVEQKPLYRRFEHINEQLRAALEAHGVHASDVQEWLGMPQSAHVQAFSEGNSSEASVFHQKGAPE
jgi:RNA polymerase sigma factor (sigma-70 family)